MSKPRTPPFVGVVTFNPMATLRFELLEQTVRSIEQAFPTARLFLLDNGSTDGSWEAVCELLGENGFECSACGRCYLRGRWHARQGAGEPKENFTPGAGRNRLWHHMFAHELGDTAGERSPFWAWSDDDMVWKPGAEAKLRDFWQEAPADIAIVSGLLEPEWPWNTPRETITGGGGVRALVRDSAPGAAWTFENPRKIWVGYGYYPKLYRFGYDYETCKALREEFDIRVAQMDLADHIGWGCSTHGNDADESPETRPLDREKWGV